MIVPVYKNEGSIPALIERLAEMNRELGGELEAVFVVDGSPDRSYLVLKERLAGAGFRSQLVALSRNFGSFAAIRQGLALAQGPYFAVMAADLQEPGEVVVEFFRRLATDEVDVTIGERVGRADPCSAALSSRLFWWAYRTFVQPEVPAGGVDVFGCNLVVRDALLSLRESNSTLVGLLFWLGLQARERASTSAMPASTAPAAGASAESTATCSTAPSPSRTCRSRCSRPSAPRGCSSRCCWPWSS